MSLPVPAITKITVAMSDAVTGYWWAGIIVIAATFFAVRAYVRTDQGRRNKDKLFLKLPVKIGTIVQKVAIARWSRTLGTLAAAVRWRRTSSASEARPPWSPAMSQVTISIPG